MGYIATANLKTKQKNINCKMAVILNLFYSKKWIAMVPVETQNITPKN